MPALGENMTIFRFIKYFTLTFVLIIATLIAVGLFLQTKPGFNMLEKASLEGVTVASGVSLKKPDNWVIAKHVEKGYELTTIKSGKTTRIGLYSISFKDLPDFKGPLSLKNKSIGKSLVSKANETVEKFAEGNRLVSSSYVNFIREYKFYSFQTLTIGSKIWAEYTTKRKDFIWKRLYTIHNDDIIVCSHSYREGKVFEDYLESVLGRIVFQ